jgi:hypothetical protein
MLQFDDLGIEANFRALVSRRIYLTVNCHNGGIVQSQNFQLLTSNVSTERAARAECTWQATRWKRWFLPHKFH